MFEFFTEIAFPILGAFVLSKTKYRTKSTMQVIKDHYKESSLFTFLIFVAFIIFMAIYNNFK